MCFKGVYKNGGWCLVPKGIYVPMQVLQTKRRIYVLHDKYAWYKSLELGNWPWREISRLDAMTILGSVSHSERTLESLPEEDQQFLWEHLLKHQ